MVDVLAFGAHPDDCEIFMGGTLLFLKSNNFKTGICDLSSGEAGTYGNSDIRKEELTEAGKVLDLDVRITLDMEDSNITNTTKNRLKIIEVIRQQKPELVFSPTSQLIRHPDHKYCGELVKECAYLAGIERIVTSSPVHRPSAVLTFPELIINGKPDFVIDVSDFWQKKIQAIRCYGSQVTGAGEDDAGTKTFIRSNRMWEILESRSIQAGAMVGVKYGEPFYSDYPPKINNLFGAFKKELK